MAPELCKADTTLAALYSWCGPEDLSALLTQRQCLKPVVRCKPHAQLNAVVVPDGVDEALVRAHVLQHWDLEIGAGLGPLKGKIWRVGLMGASATPWHVRLCLDVEDVSMPEIEKRAAKAATSRG